MNARFFCITAALCFLFIGGTGYAQSGSSLMKITIRNGNIIYGKIEHTDKSTITVVSIWERKTVIYRNEISDMQQSDESPGELLKKVEVTILDARGSTFTGNVLSATADTLQFLTKGGIRLAIPQDKIKQISTLAPEVSALKSPRQHGYWTRDRMYIFPNGYMPEKGAVYGALHYIFVPTITAGFHKYLALNAGVSLIPGLEDQIYILNPRIGIYQTENLGVALSYMGIGPLLGNSRTSQFVQAIGSASTSWITGTLGLGLSILENHNSERIMISAGVDARLSEAVHFISEYLSIGNNDGDYLMFFGFRFIGDSVAGDVCLWQDSDRYDYDEWPFQPYVALYFHF